MSRNINIDRSAGLYISYPCRHAGQWCSCWKGKNGSGRICKHKGNYIKDRNFSGSETDSSETIKQAGMGAGLFTMIVVLGGAIYILAKISKQMDKK